MARPLDRSWPLNEKHGDNATEKEMKMDKYECPCGYIYDPEEGDAENNISMGTAFEDLPDDWVCPKCGAEKEFFELLD
jgi:rubredoxin